MGQSSIFKKTHPGLSYSPVFLYICKSMSENKRNSGSAIFLISLMIVLFSFFYHEKEKKFTESSSPPIVLSAANISGTQAIIAPATSIPEISFCLLNTIHGNFILPDCVSGREFIFTKQISRYYHSFQLKFLSKNPVIGLTLLQKVPGQEKGGDPLSTA